MAHLHKIATGVLTIWLMFHVIIRIFDRDSSDKPPTNWVPLYIYQSKCLLRDIRKHMYDVPQAFLASFQSWPQIDKLHLPQAFFVIKNKLECNSEFAQVSKELEVVKIMLV